MNGFALTACHASSAGVLQVCTTDQAAQTACSRSYGAVKQTRFVSSRLPQNRHHQPNPRLQPCFIACVPVGGLDKMFLIQQTAAGSAVLALAKCNAPQGLGLTSALCSAAFTTVEVATLPGTSAMPMTGQLFRMLHRLNGNLHSNSFAFSCSCKFSNIEGPAGTFTRRLCSVGELRAI